ncbi:hypothetical protein CAPTEDRAFT_205214 [Capitella teleta]|uniref:HTH psq-type domain-containing protein n=1 Tax=Capitella teleta TaxID=283909 RepID=R7V0R0_CAPTE|nr:hypothetical protein CAPTEDRAFT_205214 [Capitella teleta]|eukprot:ELU12087.1 hypothetical protein CAPTEDRAFT_205214 [Capitella teleta]
MEEFAPKILTLKKPKGKKSGNQLYLKALSEIFFLFKSNHLFKITQCTTCICRGDWGTVGHGVQWDKWPGEFLLNAEVRYDSAKHRRAAFLAFHKEAAAKRVCAGQSVRDVADETGLPKTTLHRYVAKMNTEESPRFTPNYFVNRVFSKEEEKAFLNIYFETRVLAYEYAVRNKKKFPSGWNETKSATYDWLYGFMKRNPSLSIRSPEATSLSRSTSFNKTNVAAFFGNLKQVHEQHKHQAGRIFNVDETGLMTVQKPPKVIAAKGVKQIGQITSAERGVLVTMVGCINAQGNSIPPLLVFPRVNFKEHMLHGSPPGTERCSRLIRVMIEMFEITFLAKQPSKHAGLPLFAFPDPEDTDTIPFDQFVSKLPRPVPTGGTKRAAKRVKFDFDLRRYF